VALVKPAATCAELSPVSDDLNGWFGVHQTSDDKLWPDLPSASTDCGNNSALPIVTIFGYLGAITAITIALNGLGFDLQKIALIAGALSVGIGFGLQSVVSNFVSGLILLAEREGELVSRDEIVEKLWGKDVFIEADRSVNTAGSKLRVPTC